MQQDLNNNKNKLNVAHMGLFLAFALILGYVEAIIPFPIAIPGIKLGLPNLAVLILLYVSGAGSAVIVDILRVFLSGFLFGNMFSIVYSLAGGILSLICMVILKKSNLFSVVGVSIGGGFSHNIGQLIVAGIVLRSPGLLYYLPLLAIGGVLTGTLIGLICNLMLPVLKKVLYNDSFH